MGRSLVAGRMARRLGLEPRYAVEVERNVRVPAEDGTSLLTDVYRPRGIASAPTALLRSPYGRAPFGLSMAAPLATQGFVAIVQSCRGTGGSGGVFDPHHDEKADGLATLEWIERQPFFDGSIVTFGPSYLGYTQWAIAAAAGPEVKAMAMQVTLSDFSQMTYAGDSLMLENALSWTQLVTRMKSGLGKLRMGVEMILGRASISASEWRGLPIRGLDERVTGERVAFWQDWMDHASAHDPWWRSMDFHQTIPEIRRPITAIAGWQDIFAPWSLRDFEALQKAGVPARITIGPWRHREASDGGFAIQDALDWYAEHVEGRPSTRAAPVRLHVAEADEWRDFDQWPPKESEVVRFHLQPGGGLSDRPAETSAPDAYRYDPADPTPSLGGPALAMVPFAVDNAPLESRADVLCYTSDPLTDDLDLIGVPVAQLHVESSAVSADFFVRICDVDEAGVSRNVCDGLQRIAVDPAPGPRAVRVELWPTAHRFRRGHRLRVQVSSGAFPRFARNPGTGEPLADASALQVAEQRIHHGPGVPSAVLLPICGGARPAS